VTDRFRVLLAMVRRAFSALNFAAAIKERAATRFALAIQDGAGPSATLLSLVIAARWTRKRTNIKRDGEKVLVVLNLLFSLNQAVNILIETTSCQCCGTIERIVHAIFLIGASTMISLITSLSRDVKVARTISRATISGGFEIRLMLADWVLGL
jgi:hypothetical protein